MAICYPPEPNFLENGGPPTSQPRDIFDVLPHFDEFGKFDPRPSGIRPVGSAALTPWLTSSSIWQPPSASMDLNANANLNQVLPGSRQAAAVPSGHDDDNEWASKLARYISTPQNDFEF